MSKLVKITNNQAISLVVLTEKEYNELISISISNYEVKVCLDTQNDIGLYQSLFADDPLTSNIIYKNLKDAIKYERKSQEKEVKKRLEEIRLYKKYNDIEDTGRRAGYLYELLDISEEFDGDESISQTDLIKYVSRKCDNEETIKYLETCKDGDAIDFDGYRGIGIYILFEGRFHKTIDEYGYYLPSFLWKFIEEHGPLYFSSIGGCECIYIPKNYPIVYKKKMYENNGEYYIFTHETTDNSQIKINNINYCCALDDIFC